MKRIVDKKLCESYQGRPCIICGRSGVGHHEISRRYGHDIPQNLVALCQHHHQQRHARGQMHMVENYMEYKNWLEENGWEYDDLLKKYTNPNCGTR